VSLDREVCLEIMVGIPLIGNDLRWTATVIQGESSSGAKARNLSYGMAAQLKPGPFKARSFWLLAILEEPGVVVI